MTEERARALLRACRGEGAIEAWLAEQPWRPSRDGWHVTPDLRGRRFRLERDSLGLRIYAIAPGGKETFIWTIPE